MIIIMWIYLFPILISYVLAMIYELVQNKYLADQRLYK